MDPKNFLKEPSAPIHTSFEGGARAEKTRSFGKHFSKVSKNAFFGMFFFKILAAVQKIWPKQGILVLLECSQNQFGQPRREKKPAKLSNSFENPPPPSLEKILDPHLGTKVKIQQHLQNWSIQLSDFEWRQAWDFYSGIWRQF